LYGKWTADGGLYALARQQAGDGGTAWSDVSLKFSRLAQTFDFIYRFGETFSRPPPNYHHSISLYTNDNDG